MVNAEYEINSQVLEERVAAVTEVFTLPDVIIRLERLTKDPDSQAADISRAIETDIAMAAKVLKIVNSAFYGFNRSITNINYAVVILGFNMIRNLIMSVFFAGQCKTSVEGFNIAEFWRYAINSAFTTESIAQETNILEVNDAFIAGLMNKIGVIVLNQYFPEDFLSVLKMSNEEKITLTDAEYRVLEFSHYDIGAALLDRWNMPKEIVNVCRGVTHPDDSASKLCWACHLANTLTQALCLGNHGSNYITPLARGCLTNLNLPLINLPPLMERMLKKSAESEEFLNL